MPHKTYKSLLLIASLAGFSACTEKYSKSQNTALTGNRAKYWDVVYVTDIYGKFYSQINIFGNPMHCDKFETSGRVMHHSYLDSLAISERDCDSDVIVNPDSFTFKSDSTISFSGRTYTVAVISKDIMALKFGPNKNRIATVIYQASKLQNKKLVKCN